MPNFRSNLLRSRNGTTPEAKIGKEFSLQVTEANGEHELAGIVVDFATTSIGQHVLPLLQLLHQVRCGNSSICLHGLGAFPLKALPMLDTETCPETHTLSEIEIPQSRRKAPCSSELAFNALRQATSDV